MVQPSVPSKSEFLRTLVGAGDAEAELWDEPVEDELDDDENDDDGVSELAEEVDGATEIEVEEDAVGRGRIKVVVDVGTTAEELEVGTDEEEIEAGSVDGEDVDSLVVLDSVGRKRYRLRRFPAPQNSARFPGHGKLHSERLVGVLPFAVLILLPQKHSLPYSTPK